MIKRSGKNLALFINFVGSPVTFVAIVVFMTVFLGIGGAFVDLGIFVLATAITVSVVLMLKVFFCAPRPKDAVIRMPLGAFPSGHAAISTMSAIVIPFALYGHLSNILVFSIAAFLAISAVTVSVNRLVLRVHTAKQVWAGVAIGGAASILSISYAVQILSFFY